MRSRAPIMSVVVCALAVTACGTSSNTTATATSAGSTPASTAAASGNGGPLTKPVVTKPDGPPPTDLVVKDLVVGTGAQAVAGSTLSMQYVGISFATGKQFDASWDRGSPFEFKLGAGQVIAGWDRGIAGMRVGGRRELVIPPNLAYGDRGAGGAIGPNETLVFVVDLLAVR